MNPASQSSLWRDGHEPAVVRGEAAYATWPRSAPAVPDFETRAAPSVGAAESAADGRFTVSGLRAGPHMLQVRADGHGRGLARDVRAGTSGARVALERFARVTADLRLPPGAFVPAGRYRIEDRPRQGEPQGHGDLDLADGGSEPVSITVDP